MSHPFFDSARFPWPDPVGQAFYAALGSVFHNDAQIVALFEDVGGHQGTLTRPQPAQHLLRQVLDQLAAAGRLPALCQEIQGRSLHPSVHDAAAAVVAAQPVAERLFFDDGVILLDRERLRSSLTRLGSDNAPVNVVLVRGEPRSGKSFAKYLLRRVAAHQGIGVVEIESGLVGTVHDVIECLFDEYDARDEIPAEDTSDPAYYRKVCLALKRVAVRSGEPRWIVMDDLGVDEHGVPLLDDEILAFCDEFASLLGNAQMGKWFRLLLVHYPEDKPPTRWQEPAWESIRTRVDDVQPEHVEAYLTHWRSSDGRHLREREIPDLVEQVVTAGAGDLRQLNRALQRVLDGVR